MYDLDTITRTTIALTNKMPVQTFMESGSARFNSAWQLYLEDMAANSNSYQNRWVHASKGTTNQTHTGAFPYNKVQQASLFVAMTYILCGQEVALQQMGKQMVAPIAKSASGDVMSYVLIITDTAKRMHDYLDNNVTELHLGSALQGAITEFYSITMVALHETRRIAAEAYQGDIDKTMRQCEIQLSKYGLVPIIPVHMARQIKTAKQFADGVAATRGAGFSQQHQPQWQRQRHQPTGATRTQPSAGQGNVVSVSTVLCTLAIKLHGARCSKTVRQEKTLTSQK